MTGRRWRRRWLAHVYRYLLSWALAQVRWWPWPPNCHWAKVWRAQAGRVKVREWWPEVRWWEVWWRWTTWQPLLNRVHRHPRLTKMWGALSSKVWRWPHPSWEAMALDGYICGWGQGLLGWWRVTLPLHFLLMLHHLHLQLTNNGISIFWACIRRRRRGG